MSAPPGQFERASEKGGGENKVRSLSRYAVDHFSSQQRETGGSSSTQLL